ncbi:MAG: transglycosylase SLT domain-containing protein [bacterium]
MRKLILSILLYLNIAISFGFGALPSSQSESNAKTYLFPPPGQVGKISYIDTQNGIVVVSDLPIGQKGDKISIYRGNEIIATGIIDALYGSEGIAVKVSSADISKIQKNDSVTLSSALRLSLQPAIYATETADRIYLKNGQVMVGAIVTQNLDTVYIDTVIAQGLPVSRIDIDHIERTKNPEYWYVFLGNKALSADHYDEASRYYEKALRLNPVTPTAKDNWKYAQWLKIKTTELIHADALLAETDYHAAIQKHSFEQALLMYDELTEKYAGKPFTDEIYRQVGQIHYEMAKRYKNFEDTKKAEDEVNLALSLDTSNAAAHQLYAEIMEYRGKWNIAADELMVAKLLKPQIRLTPEQQQLVTYAETTYKQEWTAVAQQTRKKIDLASIRTLNAKLDVYNLSKESYTDATGILLQAYNAGPGAVARFHGAVNYPIDPDPVRYVAWVKQRIPYSRYKAKTKTNSQYDDIIHRLASKYRLEFDLVKAIISVESGFDNKARHEKSKCSGLMQLARSTWNDVCQNIIHTNWHYDSSWTIPERNIEVGCAYLQWLRDKQLARYFPDKF